jgi:hypothetical protein
MHNFNHNSSVIKFFLFVLIILASKTISAQTILVEAESFQNKGGWELDQQFMLEMGSPYLLAHGLGTPVADASTNVKLPSTGNYRIWVRTKDWVAQWNAKGAPGKFQLSINNQKLDTIFGTKNATWSWQNGGIVNITNSDVLLKLCDLTGFEGRCDAIVFTKDPNFIPPYEATALASWRKTMLGNALPKDAGKFDLVVVGAGMSGITAAIGAARLGLKVALVQDRPVVGGNNSTEVRVGLGGSINVAPYKNLGNIVNELTVIPNPNYPPGNGNDSVFDDTKRMNILKAEKNITLFMNYRADSVTISAQTIKSVLAENVSTAERIELFGTYFSDCTGDGTIGYLAGADYEIDVTKHMGNSNLWNLKQYTTPQPFPTLTWALDLSTKPFPGRPGIAGSYNTSGISALGGWYWESGFSHNPLTEVEYIRDYNFRAMYGAWDCVKNVDKIYPNYKLNWAAYVTGKRESRMLLGDIQLNKDVLVNNVLYPDGFVAIGWNMDVHVPRPAFQASFEGEEFISIDIQTAFKRPFYIPYRCLYSRNVNNLFMAGRNISVTQDALGTVRVMKTTGMMGEVVGLAAALCKKHNAMPRNLYESYLTELKSYITAGIPAAGDTLVIKEPVGPDPKNPQIIVDNTDAACTFDSPWPTSVYASGYIGTNYMQDGSTAADTAKWVKWTPTIPTTGLYRVYMNWTEGGGRPSQAPVEILCADSTVNLTINQQTNGSIWNLLGKYRFKAGTEGYVKLSAKAPGSTIADAVLFENVSPPTAISSIYSNESNISIYNNSSNTTAILNLAKNSRVSIGIYSLYGSEVQSIVNEQYLTADRYFYKIRNEKLNKGIYLIRLLVDGKLAECKKIVIN